MPLAEATAAIVAAIVSAVVSVATTAAGIVAAIADKDFKSATVPADTKKKLVFLQGYLKQIVDILQDLKAVDEGVIKKMSESDQKDLRARLDDIQVTLTCIESSIQTSTTETDLGIFFSWAFKLVDSLDDLLNRSGFAPVLNVLPKRSNLRQALDIINKEFPPIKDHDTIQIINTHDTKRYKMKEYLGAGPGWGIVCWDMGRYDLADTKWGLAVVDAGASRPFQDTVCLCDSKDAQTDRQVVQLSKSRDSSVKLIKHGPFAQQGNQANESNRWTFEDFADNDRRLRDSDWIAIRLHDDRENNPFVAISPRGVVCDHFDSKSVQFAQDVGANNVEWDGIWLIKKA